LLRTSQPEARSLFQYKACLGEFKRLQEVGVQATSGQLHHDLGQGLAVRSRILRLLESIEQIKGSLTQRGGMIETKVRFH